MKFIYLKMLIILILASCGDVPEDDPKIIFAACTAGMEREDICTRFMDRDVYFAFPNEGRNNSFHIQFIKDALIEIGENSFFGSNYFRFNTVDESTLLTPLDIQESTGEFRSYIQVLPDVEFDDLFNQTGPHADPNVILMVNFANKKKFSAVIRASCFEVNNFNCTNDHSSQFSQESGLRALIGRTVIRMLAVNTRNCSTNPNDVMCAHFPHDGQWNQFNKDIFFNDLKNAQSAIANNPDFYDF